MNTEEASKFLTPQLPLSDDEPLDKRLDYRGCCLFNNHQCLQL